MYILVMLVSFNIFSLLISLPASCHVSYHLQDGQVTGETDTVYKALEVSARRLKGLDSASRVLKTWSFGPVNSKKLF